MKEVVSAITIKYIHHTLRQKVGLEKNLLNVWPRCFFYYSLALWYLHIRYIYNKATQTGPII